MRGSWLEHPGIARHGLSSVRLGPNVMAPLGKQQYVSASRLFPRRPANREGQMSTLVTVDGRQVAVGKNRNPFAVIFLSIITLGIYWFVWVYKVNNEIRTHEPLVRCSPGISVLAQFIPVAN